MRPLALLLALSASAAAAQPAVERLTDALALTDDQADLAAEIYDARSPGSVWTLAAELVPTLSESQRAALYARPDRPERAAGDRAARGARRGARPVRERDPAREAAQRAARDAALGLSPEASAQLDAALADLRGPEGRRALRDGGLPASVTDLLTPEQAETVRAQRALQRHLRGGRRGRGQR